MSSSHTRPWIDRRRVGWKDVLPWPLVSGVWVFSFERRGHLYAPVSFAHGHVMLLADLRQVLAQRLHHTVGQHRIPISVAFGIAKCELQSREIDLLDPQPQAFRYAKAATLKNLPDEPTDTLQVGKHGQGLLVS